jgi:hypothetical protein
MDFPLGVLFSAVMLSAAWGFANPPNRFPHWFWNLIIATVILLLLCGLSLYACVRSSKKEERDTERKQREESLNPEIQATIDTFLSNGNESSDPGHSNNDAGNKKKRLWGDAYGCLQRVLVAIKNNYALLTAVATIVLALVTLGLAFIAYWQYQALGDQGVILATQIREYELTNRATVTVAGMKMVTESDPAGRISNVSFIPIIKNTGHTPTRNLEFVMVDPWYEGVFGIPSERGVPRDPARDLPRDPSFLLSFKNELFDVLGRQTYPLGPDTELPPALPPTKIGSELFGKIRGGQFGHFYYGIVRYNDVFDSSTIHITKYCFSINNEVMGDGGLSGTGRMPFYTICKHWNCTDEECERDSREYEEETKVSPPKSN